MHDDEQLSTINGEIYLIQENIMKEIDLNVTVNGIFVKKEKLYAKTEEYLCWMYFCNNEIGVKINGDYKKYSCV